VSTCLAAARSGVSLFQVEPLIMRRKEKREGNGHTCGSFLQSDGKRSRGILLQATRGGVKKKKEGEEAS